MFYQSILKKALFLIFLWLPFSLLSQTTPPVVINIDGDTLEFSFAGGLNNCQFGEIDLNLDGIIDLVAFDRNGGRLLPFLNKGIPNQISYEYVPQYIPLFPPISQWLQTIDYNRDGKFDLFTYTTGGIKVYKNTSNTQLQFEQVTFPFITSLQGNGSIPTNILVTSVDYSAIVDLDQDGDLDILTFRGFGSFVEEHKNLSVENYGNQEHLEFVKMSDCWGEFAEGAEGNEISLDTCLPGSKHANTQRSPKHTGSTMLATDLTGDGLIDLVIGDVDYETLVFLTNGGSFQQAKMVAYTSDFPTAAEKVTLPSFPGCNFIDVNNDGLKDLIVFPFSPSLELSKNLNNILLYLNKGSSSQPVFEFEKSDFLQHQMLDFGSGAYPAFFDFDADGLQDLVIGNWGYLDTTFYNPVYNCKYRSSLALLKNIGTSKDPVYKLITRDWLGLSALDLKGLAPTFADVDGDGDLDLICGNATGTLVFYENTATSGSAPNFEFRTATWKNIQVEKYSVPQLIDLTGDALLDLVCGNQNGTLNYYKNIGTKSNPDFLLITDTLGGINTNDPELSYYGYSVPFFHKGNDGELRLYIGSEQGKVFVYSHILGNLEGNFKLDGVLNTQNDGIRTSVSLQQTNDGTSANIFVGNYAGGLSFYKDMTPVPWKRQEPVLPEDVALTVFPNPASTSVWVGIATTNGNRSIRQIEIRDLWGRKVLEKNVFLKNETTELSIIDLNPGIYIVRCLITSESGSISGFAVKKLVVTKK